jgi:hypothetical protein
MDVNIRYLLCSDFHFRLNLCLFLNVRFQVYNHAKQHLIFMFHSWPSGKETGKQRLELHRNKYYPNLVST